MTYDEFRSRRADAQRVVDALGELFDGVPPDDRAGAEEELRDAGVDPHALGKRLADVAASSLPVAGAGPTHRATVGRRAGLREGGRMQPAAPSARAGSSHRSLRRGHVGAIAALLVGVALGWWLARTERVPQQVALQEGRTLVRTESAPATADRIQDRSRRAPDLPGSDNDSRAGANARPKDESRPDAGGVAPASAAPQAAPASHTGAPHHASVVASEEDTPPSDLPAAGGPVERAGVTFGADAEPWILERRNWEKAKDLLPARVLERVKSGDYWYTVQPAATETFERNYPPSFWAASDANAGRFDVDPNTCGLRAVADGNTPSRLYGLPFPEIRPEAPTAGCEIMWNAEAAKSIGGNEDATLSFDELETSALSAPRRLALSLRTATYLVRSADAIDNPDGLRSAMRIHATAPADLSMTALLTRRWNDPSKRDSVWTYVPALRRVRALSPANRSDGFLGSDIAVDDLSCFDGKLEDFEWHLIGSQTVLAPATAVTPIAETELSPTRAAITVPAPKAVFEQHDRSGAPWLVVENLLMVPRPVWLVEGKPRDRYSPFGKVVLYVDAALYRSYWSLAYSWQGELLKDTMCAQHWSRSLDGNLASATASTLTGVNERLSRATLARYTSQTLDRGQPDNSSFEIQAMISDRH